MLLGVEVTGQPWITQATVVPSGQGSLTYYELPAGARNLAVDRARQSDARLGYLGDWHSHPVNIGPSATDRQTMRTLVAHGDHPKPLLLLARRCADGYELDARQRTAAQLRALELVAAGALPAHHRSRCVCVRLGRFGRRTRREKRSR